MRKGTLSAVANTTILVIKPFLFEPRGQPFQIKAMLVKYFSTCVGLSARVSSQGLTILQTQQQSSHEGQSLCKQVLFHTIFIKA